MITNIYKIANYNKLLDNFDYTEIAFLQRVAYWIGRCGKRVKGDNRLWIYNTLAEWAVQMRVSISKIQTTIKKFEKEMILISEKINATKGDQTKWYTINYNLLAKYANDCFAANTLKPKTIRLKTTPKQQNNKADKVKTKTLGENIINKKKEVIIEELYINEKKIAKKMVAEWNKEFDSSTHLYIGRVNNQSAPQLAKIWGEHFYSDMERWKEYIAIIRQNRYAMQQTDKFKGNFTWATKDDTIVRMLKYNKPKIKVTNNTEITAKKIYPHKTSPFGEKTQLYNSNNKLTKQTSCSNYNYKEENLLFAKEIAEKMKKEWNEIFSYSNKPIKAYVSDKNAFRFAGLWRDIFDEDMHKWREYARLVNSSSFLMGERTSFKANFSWLLETETIQKVMAREYNVGDRIIDEKNISKNLTSIQNEVVYEIAETIKSKIKINDNEERKIFNDYILNRQFMYDPDPYQLKDLFNNTFLSPHSLIIDEKWRQLYEKTFNSYLAKKHLGINSDDIRKMMEDLVAKSDKTEAELLKAFKDIRTKLKTYTYDLSLYNLPALFDFVKQNGEQKIVKDFGDKHLQNIIEMETKNLDHNELKTKLEMALPYVTKVSDNIIDITAVKRIANQMGEQIINHREIYGREPNLDQKKEYFYKARFAETERDKLAIALNKIVPNKTTGERIVFKQKLEHLVAINSSLADKSSEFYRSEKEPKVMEKFIEKTNKIKALTKEYIASGTDKTKADFMATEIVKYEDKFGLHMPTQIRRKLDKIGDYVSKNHGALVKSKFSSKEARVTYNEGMELILNKADTAHKQIEIKQVSQKSKQQFEMQQNDARGENKNEIKNSGYDMEL